MAKLSTDDLLDAFKEMTLIELSEFVKQFEDTFGVTAAAPVAVAAAPGRRWRRRRRGRRGAGRVRRHPRGRRRQEDPGHQGGAHAHQPRPQGGQGPRRGAPRSRSSRRSTRRPPRRRRRPSRPPAPRSPSSRQPTRPAAAAAAPEAGARPSCRLRAPPGDRRLTPAVAAPRSGQARECRHRIGRRRVRVVRTSRDVALAAVADRRVRPVCDARPMSAPRSSTRHPGLGGSRRVACRACVTTRERRWCRTMSRRSRPCGYPGSTAVARSGKLLLCAASCPPPTAVPGCVSACAQVTPSVSLRKDLSWPPRATPAATASSAHPAPNRISFAKIREPLEVPDLLALQTDSFDWLLGNETLAGPGRAGAADGRTDVPTKSGLEEIFEEISPIEDFSGHDVAVVPRPPVRAAEEHGRRVQGARLHLLRAAVRHGRVHEQRDRRDQEPDGLHGRLPADDRQGHLHHQRHRACRRLPAGPLAGRLLRAQPSTRPPTRTSSPPRSSRRRGAWLEFEIDKSDMVGVRLDRKRKQTVTVLLKALGWRRRRRSCEEFGEYESMRLTLEKDHTTDPGRGAARHLPQAAPGRAADPRGRADAARQLLLQPEALRPGQGRPLQGQQEARPRRAVRPADAHHRRHRRDDPLHRRAARRRGDARRRRAGDASSRPTTSTTSATAACAPSAS